MDNFGDGNAKSSRRYLNHKSRNINSHEFVVLQIQLALFPSSRRKQVTLIIRLKVHLIWQGGRDENIEGGHRKFLDTRKGGSENLYTLNPKGGGRLLKKWTASEGAAKISSLEFQYLHPHPCHTKWTFPKANIFANIINPLLTNLVQSRWL